MTLVFVVCEGQTEETFVRDVLARSLSGHGLILSAKTIETSPGHSGGALNYDRVWPDIRRYLLDKSTPVVTTLFDLYKLDKRFPKVNEAAGLGSDLRKRLEMLTQALHADIIDKTGCPPGRFIPYIQPYEFEALLFSDVATLVSIEPGWEKAVTALAGIRNQAKSPEHINDRPETKPAAHLERELRNPHYRKTRHGPIAAERIGLARIETECEFFAGWLSQLRSLVTA